MTKAYYTHMKLLNVNKNRNERKEEEKGRGKERRKTNRLYSGRRDLCSAMVAVVGRVGCLSSQTLVFSPNMHR